jgi:DMSO/TMAO reductase YedYZ molybdopterin-dependent catalytic subunit
MTTRPPARSLFRPPSGVDHDVLHEHRDLIAQIERRQLLKGALSLGALSLLTGCDVSDDSAVRKGLLAVSRMNDRVQEAIFRPDHLAPVYDASLVLKPPRYNAHYEVEDVKPVDGSTWRLQVSGLVRDKGSWTAESIHALPEQTLVIKHICVEGWDYIGQWSGPNLRAFLQQVGADLTAKYINFDCADGYTESCDMATALHPQTLLATKYAGEILPQPYGFPLRLRTSTKLGFKNPKWITGIEVTNTFRPSFFSAMGNNWFSGI